MKPLPMGQKIKPTSWKKLKTAERKKALCWMLEGLDLAVKDLIQKKAYHHFRYCVTKGIDFDPVVVWNMLQPRSQDHFAHSLETYQNLQRLIEEIDKIEPKDQPPTVEDVVIEDDIFDGGHQYGG